jgi:hypothetical protein
VNSAVITFEVDLGAATLVQVQAGNGAFGNGSIITVNITASGTYSIVTTTRGSGGCGLTFKAGSAATFFLSRVSVKRLPGNHAYQSNASQRPLYQIDSNGKPFLLFDGSDDGMLTNTITPGIDKAQVFAGVRKLSDATIGIVVESSANIGSNSGALGIYAPASTGTATYQWLSRGTGLSVAPSPASYPAPITNVLTGIGDIAADTAILRANGTQVSTSATDQGTGNYLAYPLYVGRRGGISLPFNGRLYSLIVRFGANLTASQIAQMEAWVNSKTGAY